MRNALFRRRDLCLEQGSEDLRLVHFVFKHGQLRISAMKANQSRGSFHNTSAKSHFRIISANLDKLDVNPDYPANPSDPN